MFGNRVGTGSIKDSLIPVIVAMPFRCPISIIACGSYHTAAVNGVKTTSFCEGVNDVDVVLFRVEYERRRGVNMVDVAMPFRCPISIIACGSYQQPL